VSENSIFALATPPGRSALAIIRISGKNLPNYLSPFLPAGTVLIPKHFLHTKWSHKGVLIDDIILLYFQSPRSFTGEDVVEINCHGNPVIIQNISESLLSIGFEQAKPGEFTRRAYQNKKMNRDQALAIQEIIDAKAEQDLQSAMRLREGSLSKLFLEFKASLLTLTADLTAELDFVEEGIKFADRGSLHQLVDEIGHQLTTIREVTKTAEIYRNGFNVTIAGLPNAGKSSLLNALCGYDRAIVSPTPGTTRDVIHYECIISGIPIRFSDTAGIRKESHDPIELQGIEKGLTELENADLTILVIDSSQSPDSYFNEISGSLNSLINNKGNLTLLNKWEIKDPDWIDTKLYQNAKQVSLLSSSNSSLEIVLNWLKEYMTTLVPANGIQANYWQKIQISELHALIKGVEEYLRSEQIEIAVQMLTESLDVLSELTGEIDNEEILDKVFSRFCVGK
jgi:tRNA modification GTPase